MEHKPFYSKVKKALKYIEQTHNPIAQSTMKKIKELKIVFLPYDRIRQSDYRELKRYATIRKDFHLVQQSKKPSKKELQLINEFYIGYPFNNKRIYLSCNIKTIKEMAKIIIHEMNHIIMGDFTGSQDYNAVRELEYEVSARLSEEMLLNCNLTHELIEEIKHRVINEYELHKYAKLQMNKDIDFESMILTVEIVQDRPKVSIDCSK